MLEKLIIPVGQESPVGALQGVIDIALFLRALDFWKEDKAMAVYPGSGGLPTYRSSPSQSLSESWITFGGGGSVAGG